MNVGKIKQYGIKESIRIFFLYKFEPVIAKLFCGIFTKLKVRNAIIFASHNDFDMNSGALYDYLQSKPESNNIKMIWFVEHMRKMKLPANTIQVPIKGLSIKRYYWNSVARFIFFDDTNVYKRRKEQKCIYLGHATRAMKNVKGKVPIPNSVDFVCSSSEKNDKLMSEVYVCDISKMIHTGFPVTDCLFEKWNELDKISRNHFKKVIIWMPTFRKSMYSAIRNDSDENTETGLSMIDTVKSYDELNEWLEKRSVLLIIKFHPAQDMNAIHLTEKTNIELLSPEKVKELQIDTYKLLTQTDALISDYSSISFDYLLLDRPLAYVLSDEKSYKMGFAAVNHEHYMPGDYLYTKDDMFSFLEKIERGDDSKGTDRAEIRDEVAMYNDGHVCERITEEFNLLQVI